MRCFLLILIFPLVVLSQSETRDSLSIEKLNPIIFGEYFVGISSSETLSGFSIGGNLNYQFNKSDLLTLRATYFSSFKFNLFLNNEDSELSINAKEKIREYGLLYGKRYVFEGSSLSFSGGIGYFDRDYYTKSNRILSINKQDYFGFPFEINYKLFKSKKRRFRAYYGIIPVGKRKVAFGRSIGFKLVGNISKNSYLGFGISYGLGTHKAY